MSSRLDLGPADLDRLEDALEDLELRGESVVDVDSSDPVALRLMEYRVLLELSREAMPLQEVPAGLLDGVLAQARQAAATAPAAAAPPSLWARWRLGLWMPALAFAGGAALLLVMLVPNQDNEGAVVATGAEAAKDRAPSATAPSAAAEAKLEQRLALAEPLTDGKLEEADAMRGAGVAIGEPAPVPVPVQDPALVAEAVREKPAPRSSASGGSAPPSEGVEPTTKPSAAPKLPGVPAGGGKGKTAPLPDPVVDHAGSQSKKDDGGEDRWPEITRADADRRAGSCGLAKMRYEKLRKEDDARVRARALAGLGLCEATAGSMATAKKLFDQARAADPTVSGFIDTELSMMDARDPSPQSAD